MKKLSLLLLVFGLSAQSKTLVTFTLNDPGCNWTLMNNGKTYTFEGSGTYDFTSLKGNTFTLQCNSGKRGPSDAIKFKNEDAFELRKTETSKSKSREICPMGIGWNHSKAPSSSQIFDGVCYKKGPSGFYPGESPKYLMQKSK